MFLRDSPSTDAVLVSQALSSQPAAFERLVLRYQQKALAIARALGVRPGSVDDVVQESFLQAFCGLGELRSPASFGPWLLTIVRNLSRKEIESFRRPLDPSRLEPRLGAAAPIDTAELEELREHLWREVQSLPEGIREAIFLYYHEGESVRRVAWTLEISASAVKSRLQRGRDQLRQQLWRELEESLRDMIPSTREWRQRGRKLTLLLIATASTEKALACTGIALPPATPSVGNFVQTTISGVLLMSLKKLFLGAGLAALLIASTIAITTYAFRRAPVENGEVVDSRQAPPNAAGASDASALGEKSIERAPQATRAVTGISGTVLLEKGPAPAAGVRVAAILDGEQNHTKETTTAPDGTYTLADLRAGKYLVWAWKDDWTTHSPWSTDHEVEVRDGALVKANDLTLVPGVIVEGRVVEEGTRCPIASASVQLRPVQSANADREGRFRLEGLPDGLISISTKADGYSRRAQEIDVEHGELPSLEIALSPGGTIEGSVKAVDGTAAAGVEVIAAGPFGGGARTDDGGRYRIEGVPLTARTIELTASRGGCFATQATLAGYAAGETRILQDLQLEKGFLLKGRVLDDAGQPVSEAKIQIGGSLSVRKVVSDVEGRFVIEGASERMHSLSARQKDHAPAWLNLREVAPESRENIELVLGMSRVVEGAVVDEQGAPIDRATVYVYPEHPVPAGPSSTKTDANGRFRVEDLPSRLREINAEKKGYADGRFNDFKADQLDIRIVLREAGQIQGVVVDKATGASVHPCVVKINFAQGKFSEENMKRGLPGGHSSSLGSEGLPFDFPDGRIKIRSQLASGIFYKLLVVAPGYSEVSIDGVEAWPRQKSREPIRVELEKGKALRGRVVAPGARDPVADVKVSHLTVSERAGRGYWREGHRGDDTSVRVSVTDASGGFTIDGLPDTSGVLLLEKPGFARTAVHGAAPTPETQVFELALASAIEGTVRNGAGEPVIGADATTSVDFESFPGVTTDAKGFYRIDGLPAGTANVVVRYAGSLEKHATTALSPGEVAVVDFAQGTGSIRVRVSDGGKPLPRAPVIVKSLKDKSEQASGSTDGEGQYRINGLEPGSYEVKAARPDAPNPHFGGVSRALDVGSGEVFTEIPLALAGGLSGRVVDRLSGNPVKGAKLIAFRHSTSLFTACGFKFPGGEWEPAGNCNAEGEDAHFQLTTTGAGAYLLTVAVGGGQGTQHGWLGPIEIEAGGQADDLTISVGGAAALALTVRDAKSGAPIEGANIILRPEGTHPVGIASRSDGAGTALISNAPTGKYRLEVESALHLSHFEEIALDESQLSRGVTLEPPSWIVVELGGSAKLSVDYALRATLVAGGDPAWTFSSLDGKSLSLGSTRSAPGKRDAKMRLKTRAGRFTIRFEVGQSLGAPPLLAQELEVDVPREGEASARLLLPEK